MRSNLVGTALGLPIVVPRPAPRIARKKRSNHVKVDRLDLKRVTLTPDSDGSEPAPFALASSQ